MLPSLLGECAHSQVVKINMRPAYLWMDVTPGTDGQAVLTGVTFMRVCLFSSYLQTFLPWFCLPQSCTVLAAACLGNATMPPKYVSSKCFCNSKLPSLSLHLP